MKYTSAAAVGKRPNPADIAKEIHRLVHSMTVEEKIGQLSLVQSTGSTVITDLKARIAKGAIGGIINEVNVDRVNELQRIAVEESRLGIPLLIGRDVIHGFRTIFPIPLGLAATWDPELIQRTARVAAREASACGINWTYAPMIDICRDPRWGRIAESLGEDPYLSSILADALIRGFQGNDLGDLDSVAACAKHFVGYGASESGRDYNVTNLPIGELRNVHLPPFKAAVRAGVASIMTSFSDIDGTPATANEYLLRNVLREEWGFDGFVVSDWNSIPELQIHGVSGSDKESAFIAAGAGVDMEMTSTTFSRHLADLIGEGKLSIDRLDQMVSNILRVKLRLRLGEKCRTEPGRSIVLGTAEHLNACYEAAVQSLVLLKNNDQLPLSPEKTKSIAVIGPLADEQGDQLGTWVFDGDPAQSVTPLAALQNLVGQAARVRYVRAMSTTRSQSDAHFSEAIGAASESDVVIMFMGEEAILSGEAHSRADIRLPGNQERLIEAIAAIGKPIVLVIMAGRPIALEEVVRHVDALLFAWHPGSMAGPAIIDVLFGRQYPSGKLPVTFPRVSGQIPIYYAHKNTGRPANPEQLITIDDIPAGAAQQSLGDASFHIDAGCEPMFPFGYGLSYTQFAYSDIRVSRSRIRIGEEFEIMATLSNVGNREGMEIAQLYVRDMVGSVTRPVRELKRFARIHLRPGENAVVKFTVHTDDLAFYGRSGELSVEPGAFHAWIGSSSTASLQACFELSSQ